MSCDGVISLWSHRHLVSRSQVIESHCWSSSWWTRSQTLSSGVSDLVTVRVKTEETVVAAAAVVSAGLLAGVSGACEVSGRVLDAGWQTQVLLVSQASITACLALSLSLLLVSGVDRLSAAVVTLSKNREELSVKRHSRGGVAQLGRGLDLRLK